MPRVPGSFYEPDGERYLATKLTRGPWALQTLLVDRRQAG